MASRPLLSALLGVCVALALAACGSDADGAPARADAAVAATARRARIPPYRAPTAAGGRLLVRETGGRRAPCLEASLTTRGGGSIAGVACQQRATAGATMVASWVLNCSLERFVVWGWVRSPVRYVQARMTDDGVRRATPLRTRRGATRTAFVLELRLTDRVQAIEGLDRRGRVVRTNAGQGSDGSGCEQLPIASGDMADFP